ncbi:ArsR/SmtB family transcription factor [Brachybacterium sp. AOP43-C2-M15]|uniref:ArsR/SmtB family transcription factor n=1 Tax=Brachybacterium sp. AOP43-C2-M15 TaxID=3457661 RepID=UPI0040348A67
MPTAAPPPAPTAVHTALSLPLRREILEVLRDGSATVGEIIERTGAAQASISKQLRVLREAGFVQVTVDAQRRWYSLRPEPFTELADWLEPYRWLWEDRLDRLGERLDRMQDDEERR